MSSDRKPLIGYVLKRFPKLSETFILNEILELERQGLNLHIFSLRPPQDSVHHPAVQQVKAPVTYVPSLLPDADEQQEDAALEAHQAFERENPERLESAMEFYTRCPEDKDPNELLQACYLARDIQRLGIEHVHVHFANVPTATVELVQKLCNVSYSMTAHAKDIYLTPPDVLDRRMTAADFVLTCTDFNRRHLSQISKSTTPIHLSYHGIDLTQFTLESVESTIAQAGVYFQNPHRTVRLLSVGRFCEKKGFYYLLNACCFLKAKKLPFTCTLVGYGPMQEQLEQLIDDYQLADVVTLAGKLTHDQVIEQYRRADIMVLPCVVTTDGDRDGIPNVLLEAMAMGLPVVSTNISGIGELIQSGRNGLLVPQRNVEDLAIALERLIHDPSLRKRLGNAGQRTVHQQFTLEQNVGDVKGLLLSALKTSRESCSPTPAARSAPRFSPYKFQIIHNINSMKDATI